MQPRFNIEREQHNHLFYKEYVNDKCVFQFHSHIELYFVDEGEMNFFVSGQKKTLTSGEMSVALSYESHAYSTPVASRSSILIIPVYLCENFVRLTEHKTLTTPFITDKAAFRKIKACIEELKRGGINEIEQAGYLNIILGTVLDLIFSEKSVATADQKVPVQILLYISEHFKQDLTLDVLSEKFGYNKSYISRYFKASFGIGFCRYLASIRLKNALIMMNKGHQSITTCALESGFGSVRSFYRTFFEEFGCAPGEYLSHRTENNRLEKFNSSQKASFKPH